MKYLVQQLCHFLFRIVLLLPSCLKFRIPPIHNLRLVGEQQKQLHRMDDREKGVGSAYLPGSRVLIRFIEGRKMQEWSPSIPRDIAPENPPALS